MDQLKLCEYKFTWTSWVWKCKICLNLNSNKIFKQYIYLCHIKKVRCGIQITVYISLCKYWCYLINTVIVKLAFKQHHLIGTHTLPLHTLTLDCTMNCQHGYMHVVEYSCWIHKTIMITWSLSLLSYETWFLLYYYSVFFSSPNSINFIILLSNLGIYKWHHSKTKSANKTISSYLH